MDSSSSTTTPTVRSVTAAVSDSRASTRFHSRRGPVVQPTAASTSSTALDRSRYSAVPSANVAVNMAERYCPSWLKSVMANSTQPMMKHRMV